MVERIGFLILLLILVVHLGYLIARIPSLRWARIIAWTFVISSIIVAHQIAGELSYTFRMLALITTTLFGMKSVVLLEVYQGKPKLNYVQWLAFSIGWFGMRPQLFEKLPSAPLDGQLRLWIKGTSRILGGILLLIFSVTLYDTDAIHYLVSAVFALVGMSLILHFGVLNVSAAGWRAMGVDCRELFRSPGLSMSLNEFWGKRWNLAFSEMTAVVVYRPLKDKMGKGVAVFAAFLFSGLLHELAISLPVHAGYGLPLLYFCIHGLLMLVEDKLVVIKKILQHKIGARIWVITWLIVPMPLLFHKEFMGKIVFPLTSQITAFFLGS